MVSIDRLVTDEHVNGMEWQKEHKKNKENEEDYYTTTTTTTNKSNGP